ncbi:hypothetical protein ASD21_14530 [Caulobacter sp. Root1455]|jgi:hypothetical protein|uniref:hypothetical protein n=1 Tax=unclassified Caulobacter TaxID=2648921 RepID=UPI0007022556|nr:MULTISPECIES: hypothetical protein [unclassified Caulobacter]KQY30302.1 hypothetical protein ASD38_13605 [Caulobacter sp. Root487D2Y]KQY92598.1 hypothetical protein ASD21_14530 [Caulobacter sp. Root1455]
MADNIAPQDGSRPGVLGDYSQAQDLGQPGHPEDRISETEVKEAFQNEETPTSRAVEPPPEGEKHDQLAEHVEAAEDRQEALIDESLEESFPASDPPSAKRIT